MATIGTLRSFVELRHHFFPKMHVEAVRIPAELKGAQPDFGYEYNIEFAVLGFDAASGITTIQLNLETREAAGKFKGYDVSLTVVGSVVVAPQAPEDKKQEIAAVAGSSLLYSVAREQIYALTLRGPYPPLHIPDLHFVARNE